MGDAVGRKLDWPHVEQSRRGDALASSKPTRELNEGENFEVFISYYRHEAGLDARLLHSALEHRLGKPCFLDASCASALLGQGLDEIKSIITSGIKRSRALVLLQTKNVLSRPFVLLEVYTAITLGLPIVPVVITEEGHPGAGYDFERSKEFLRNLADEIEQVNACAASLMSTFLAENGSTLEQLQRTLSRTLPNVISISLQPDGTRNHWHAVVQDILDKTAIQRRRSSLAYSPPPKGRIVGVDGARGARKWRRLDDERTV